MSDGVQDESQITRRGTGERRLRRWWSGGCCGRAALHTERGAEVSSVLGIADSERADRGNTVH